MLSYREVIAFLLGVMCAAMLAAGIGHDAPERRAHELRKMEILMKLAPIWCGDDGCQ